MSSFKISKLFSAKGTVNRCREHCSLSSSNYCCLWSLVEVLFPGKVSYLQIPTFWLMGVVVFVLAVVWKRIQQLPTMLRLLQYVVGRIQPVRLAGRPCVMRVCAWPQQCWKSRVKRIQASDIIGDQRKTWKECWELFNQRSLRIPSYVKRNTITINPVRAHATRVMILLGDRGSDQRARGFWVRN